MADQPELGEANSLEPAAMTVFVFFGHGDKNDRYIILDACIWRGVWHLDLLKIDDGHKFPNHYFYPDDHPARIEPMTDEDYRALAVHTLLQGSKD